MKGALSYYYCNNFIQTNLNNVFLHIVHCPGHIWCDCCDAPTSIFLTLFNVIDFVCLPMYVNESIYNLRTSTAIIFKVLGAVTLFSNEFIKLLSDKPFFITSVEKNMETCFNNYPKTSKHHRSGSECTRFMLLDHVLVLV